MTTDIKTRNLGVDLLRITAMFMVVILHVLGHGGLLMAVAPKTLNYNLVWFLEIMAYCAVDCYALITGYVLVNSGFKLSRILKLWVEVLFYSIAITAVIAFFQPDLINLKIITATFFPLLTTRYWYFTAYFGLFFFIPFLNYLINSIEEKQLRKLILASILLFSIIPTMIQRDLFLTGGGGGTLWLGVLYLIGAYIKKYDFNKLLNKNKYLLLYFSCIIIVWATKLAIELLTFKILGEPKGGDFFISYTSPFILLAGISLVNFFSQLNFKEGYLSKAITILAPSSFAVYLIHDHFLIREFYLGKSTMALANFTSLKMIALVFSLAIAIYLICSLIDYLRIKLFRVLKINILIDKISEKLLSIFSKTLKL